MSPIKDDGGGGEAADEEDSSEVEADEALKDSSMDATLTEDQLLAIRATIRNRLMKRAREMRLKDLQKEMTTWLSADSYLRMIMLKGIEIDPSGNLKNQKTK